MSDVRDPDRDQPLPVGNNSVPIHRLVMEDLAERLEHGTRKYGQPLQAHNGRNALQDAYEEALDLCVYLKQALEERKTPDFEVTPTGTNTLSDPCVCKHQLAHHGLFGCVGSYYCPCPTFRPKED